MQDRKWTSLRLTANLLSSTFIWNKKLICLQTWRIIWQSQTAVPFSSWSHANHTTDWGLTVTLRIRTQHDCRCPPSGLKDMNTSPGWKTAKKVSQQKTANGSSACWGGRHTTRGMTADARWWRQELDMLPSHLLSSGEVRPKRRLEMFKAEAQAGVAQRSAAAEGFKHSSNAYFLFFRIYIYRTRTHNILLLRVNSTAKQQLHKKKTKNWKDHWNLLA